MNTRIIAMDKGFLCTCSDLQTGHLPAGYIVLDCFFLDFILNQHRTKVVLVWIIDFDLLEAGEPVYSD